MQTITLDRRLLLLKTLCKQPARRLNSHVLTNVVNSCGLPGTQDDVEADLNFLQESECVVLETMGEFTIAELVARGENVAKGTVRIAGVARPGPRG